MGRPAKFTPEVKTRIVLALKAGAHPVVAARAAGVGASTFFHWMADTRRPYRDFRQECEKAIAEYEIHMGGLILQGAAHSPASALKLLAVRFPQRFARTAPASRRCLRNWDPTRTTRTSRPRLSPSGTS